MKYYTLTYITLNLTDLLTCALALAGFKFQLGHLLAECLCFHTGKMGMLLVPTA